MELAKEVGNSEIGKPYIEEVRDFAEVEGLVRLMLI